VSPHTDHNFAIDPKTGDLFVADEFFEGVHNFARVQKFGPKGEFLAENRFALTVTTAAELGGIAIDAATNRLYVLVNETRPGEEETVVYDPELTAADTIWSLSTEETSEKLKEQKQLTKEAGELKPLSEEPKAALVDPAGIAVDRKTHDVVILGQQDESTLKGSGEEQFRAAVERVHADGTLGPRYIDQGNCLDGAEPSAEEKASSGEKPCGEKGVEQPRSPIATPLGRVYVEGEDEIWEIPAPTTGEESFKEVTSKPKRIFRMGAQQSLITTGGQEQQAGTMSFASLGSGEGRIYLTATIAGEQSESGVLVLNYVEHGEAAEVTESGWTGGQNSVSKQAKCIIPIASVEPLVAAGSGEQVLVFDATSALEGSHVELFAFGPGLEAEACGHATASPPVVEVGEEKNATKVETGKLATITSHVTGANAMSTKWKLVFTPAAGEKVTEELTTGYQFAAPTLSYEFTRVGHYEITETVETDNLGSAPIVVKAAQAITTTPSPPKVKIVTPHTSVVVGQMVAFEANVIDNNEATPHLKYTWSFGDGSSPVVDEEAATKSTVTRRVEHAFQSRCGASCKVTLEVEDLTAKVHSSAKAEVPVGEGQAEREARERSEHEKAEHERTEREAREQGEREKAAREKAEREASEKRAGEVLPSKASSNPEAKIAGTALSVSANGNLTIKISCPSDEGAACIGTVTLHTLTAVSATHSKRAILTLASGTFSVAGGQTKTVTLHLSTKARSLLSRSHVLAALTRIVAHDSAGVTKTTTSRVMLRLVKPHGKHH
jgi:hypothetical protein